MNKYHTISLNEYDQWISVSGDSNKPLLLVLHGGPGTPCMSLFRKWNKPLLDDFLVVTWDQRGTGRSFDKMLDKATLSVSQLVKDTHQLTNYLKDTYKKEKIYLMGHSFGATLGLKVVHESPEDYYAYFGVSQFVNARKNEASCYKWLLEEATKRKDKGAIKVLKKIGAPADGFYRGGLKMTMKTQVKYQPSCA